MGFPGANYLQGRQFPPREQLRTIDWACGRGKKTFQSSIVTELINEISMSDKLIIHNYTPNRIRIVRAIRLIMKLLWGDAWRDNQA